MGRVGGTQTPQQSVRISLPRPEAECSDAELAKFLQGMGI